MVSFFGLGKKKKADAGSNEEPPRGRSRSRTETPTQWKKIDRDALGEGQYFGTNIKNKGVINGSIRDVSRPGTSASMRNSPYALQTHNFAASSMYDLSNLPGPSWGVEVNGGGLKTSSSDANLGMRWGNSSSASLQAPSALGLRPGTPIRPGTAGGERKKPWVNPLDVHFGRSTPTPAPKSPLGQFDLQLQVDVGDGTGSLMSDEKPVFSRGAEHVPPPIITQVNSTSPPSIASPLSPLGDPPYSPPTGSLPSPPRSVNGAASERNLRPQQARDNLPKGFGPTALPSPALSQRGGSEDNSAGGSSSRNGSNPWEGLGKPVIQNVAAKRDTLTINGPRRQSLSMKIEEFEKSLVNAQQESEQKSKAAAAVAAGHGPPSGGRPLQVRNDGYDEHQFGGRNALGVGFGGPGAAGNGGPVDGARGRPPMRPEDRRPRPAFANNNAPRPQSPIRRGPPPNTGPPPQGPNGRGMPPPRKDYFDDRNRDARNPNSGRPPPHGRIDQRPNPPFANRGPGSRPQSPMGRNSPGLRPESPMDRYMQPQGHMASRGPGLESPVIREPPPRSPMRNPPPGPLDGPPPGFPKRNNGPNGSLSGNAHRPQVTSNANPPKENAVGEPSGPNNSPSPAPEPSRPSPPQPASRSNTPNGGPAIRGPFAPRRPAPEEYGVMPRSNSDRDLGRGPPRAAVGAHRGNAPPQSPRRFPSEDSDSFPVPAAQEPQHQPLHPPPRPQQQQSANHLQEPNFDSSDGDMRHNKFAAPLPSPLWPNKDSNFGSGALNSAPLTGPSVVDPVNWPLPAAPVMQVPPRPRTAGGDGNASGAGLGLGIGMGQITTRKPQRPNAPPPLNLFSAKQYVEEIGNAGPYTPSPPMRSMTTPVAACDESRPRTAGGGAGTIGMARGLSLRYEREREREREADLPTARGVPGVPGVQPQGQTPRRPDFGLNAPTGIADRFGTGFI